MKQTPYYRSLGSVVGLLAGGQTGVSAATLFVPPFGRTTSGWMGGTTRTDHVNRDLPQREVSGSEEGDTDEAGFTSEALAAGRKRPPS